MSGDDFYTSSDLRILIHGGIGPAPRITEFFGDTSAEVSPAALLDGSIWENGYAGISLNQGTYPAFSGLRVTTGMATPSFTPQNIAGVYAVFSVSTIGVPAGSYSVSLEGTELHNLLNSDGDPIPTPLELPNFTLGVFIGASPDPATSIPLGSTLSQSTPTELSSAIQLSNTGVLATALTVEGATITGPNAALCKIAGGFSPIELLAGEAPQNFGIQFAGAAAPGTYTAQATFTFSDGPPLTYPLTVTVVPEPSTCALAAMGAVALLAARRRKTVA